MDACQVRHYIRATIGPADANDLPACYRSLAMICAREGLARVLVLIDGAGGSTAHYLVRRSIGAMAVAGTPTNFRMALVARSVPDYKVCKYAEVVAARRSVRARAFLDETEAIRWLESEDQARLYSKDAELRPQIVKLGEQLDDLVAKLRAYREATPDNAGDALAALEGSLAACAEAQREITAQLGPS
jgi:hypothetical protein